jgi:hypothetical protein
VEFFLGVRLEVERWARFAASWSSMFASRAFASRLPTARTRSRSGADSFASFASSSLLYFMPICACESL